MQRPTAGAHLPATRRRSREDRAAPGLSSAPVTVMPRRRRRADPGPPVAEKPVRIEIYHGYRALQRSAQERPSLGRCARRSASCTASSSGRWQADDMVEPSFGMVGCDREAGSARGRTSSGGEGQGRTMAAANQYGERAPFADASLVGRQMDRGFVTRPDGRAHRASSGSPRAARPRGRRRGACPASRRGCGLCARRSAPYHRRRRATRSARGAAH